MDKPVEERSVVDMVHDMDRAATAARDRERKEYEERIDSDRKRLDYIRPRVLGVLMEIHGHFGFEVEPIEPLEDSALGCDQWGSVARVNRKFTSIDRSVYRATLCLSTGYGTFRGSDDSPEQDYSFTQLYLARIVNGDREIDLRLSDQMFSKAVDELVIAFRRELAEWCDQECRRMAMQRRSDDYMVRQAVLNPVGYLERVIQHVMAGVTVEEAMADDLPAYRILDACRTAIIHETTLAIWRKRGLGRS